MMQYLAEYEMRPLHAPHGHAWRAAPAQYVLVLVLVSMVGSIPLIPRLY